MSAVRSLSLSLSRIVESDGDTALSARAAITVSQSSPVINTGVELVPDISSVLTPPVLPPLPQRSPGNAPAMASCFNWWRSK